MELRVVKEALLDYPFKKTEPYQKQSKKPMSSPCQLTERLNKLGLWQVWLAYLLPQEDKRYFSIVRHLCKSLLHTPIFLFFRSSWCFKLFFCFLPEQYEMFWPFSWNWVVKVRISAFWFWEVCICLSPVCIWCSPICIWCIEH